MLVNYNDWVINELEEWAETFRDDVEKDEDDELVPTNSFELIHELIERFENKTCTKEDYENILFHLWQKNDFTDE